MGTKTTMEAVAAEKVPTKKKENDKQQHHHSRIRGNAEHRPGKDLGHPLPGENPAEQAGRAHDQDDRCGADHHVLDHPRDFIEGAVLGR